MTCYHLKCLITHVLRVTRRETDTHLRCTLCHKGKELWESHFLVMVAVHVLTKERNLLVSTILQVLHLVEYALYLTASLTSTSVRHDAVVAEIVASTHDADKS